VVPEAPLEQTPEGLLPAREGWFVLNAREAAWREAKGMGKWPRLEGATPMFPQLGLGLTVLEPGEPMTRYHWETDQEDFLLLAGEAVAIVEGEERPLRRGAYTVDPAALRHGVGVEEVTTDADVAYAAFGERATMRYREGWLPRLVDYSGSKR
jgi:uncharacterized cupin superfamily protein